MNPYQFDRSFEVVEKGMDISQQNFDLDSGLEKLCNLECGDCLVLVVDSSNNFEEHVEKR